MYRKVWRWKRGGGRRQISAPFDELKSVQRAANAWLLGRLTVHESARGSVAGGSVLSAVSPHCGREWVSTVDIADFFPTINHLRVRASLSRNGIDQHTADVLTRLCTLGGALPQGAPTSPLLANAALFGLDRRLRRNAHRVRATYTRYMDDLIFSSNADIRRLTDATLSAIIRAGFAPNYSKTRVQHRSQEQLVCGLVVNDRPRLRPDYVRRVAALLDRYSEVVARSSREVRGRLDAGITGHLGFIVGVDVEIGRAFQARFRNARLHAAAASAPSASATL